MTTPGDVVHSLAALDRVLKLARAAQYEPSRLFEQLSAPNGGPDETASIALDSGRLDLSDAVRAAEDTLEAVVEWIEHCRWQITRALERGYVDNAESSTAASAAC
ncbi:hypothetical protein TH66_13030 [Carbonactinospora thermoautotrophica]|uniref:Uncharacterized protein n=1 Tax=Carbonactinospora thermoautotrophica TaxID=1469144 RepID=A0A132NEY3_9ACTN|nr:hypothetical protein [Carbonactinospora thermoautotrophica]KWX03716.1 hypothetical protein TH66_13030 [Carbonactinospora thermoautotrophica]KWX08182.1 hypothetical protein TR74_16135 [Carbonactinospora thermoautotrophica]